MKTIIAGSRGINNSNLIINDYLMKFDKWEITEIISGANYNSPDHIGELYGEGEGIKVSRYLADWDNEKKAAGFNRNRRMSEDADKLIAFYNGTSSGTKHMIEIMEKMGKEVAVYNIKTMNCFIYDEKLISMNNFKVYLCLQFNEHMKCQTINITGTDFNRAYLIGVINALEMIKINGYILNVICNNDYLVNVLNKWMTMWSRFDWKAKNGNPIKNLDLIKTIFKLFKQKVHISAKEMEVTLKNIPGYLEDTTLYIEDNFGKEVNKNNENNINDAIPF